MTPRATPPLRFCLSLALGLAVALPAPALARAQPPAPEKQAPQTPEGKDGATKDDGNDREERREDGTMRRAGEIVTQPARDVGISRTRVPPVLEQAAQAPYAPPSGRKCRAVLADLAELNVALGPDFDAPPGKENRAGKIAEAGGQTIVNSLIPFRGLVRELSGAAPAERRLEAAISAGIARRGYLRGLATARRCKMPASVLAPAPAPEASRSGDRPAR